MEVPITGQAATLTTANPMENPAETRFSHYSRGYINRNGIAVLSTRPILPSWTIQDAHRYITSNAARYATEGIIALVKKRKDINKPTKAENDAEQTFKKLNFEIATFVGEFSYREAKSLIRSSCLVTIDLDHIGDYDEVERVKSLLIKDRWLVSALCFRSPRQDGLKNVAIVPEAWRGLTHKEMYLEVRKYILFEYGVVVDESGSDVSRACYLPCDPECYINPLFIKNN